jgi:hypothetical protein
MWLDNGDGTYTAEKGDTLWDLYGSEWQEKSGYTGDPHDLQIGDIVGAKQSPLKTEQPATDIATSSISSSGSDATYYKVGLSLKGALCFGIGLEAGAIFDTEGQLGVYGTFYAGTGWQVGQGDPKSSIAKQIFDLLFGGGISGSSGTIQNAGGTSFTADGGAFVLGSWDFNNKATFSGVSGVGFGGGVWKGWTGVLKISGGSK